MLVLQCRRLSGQRNVLNIFYFYTNKLLDLFWNSGSFSKWTELRAVGSGLKSVASACKCCKLNQLTYRNIKAKYI